MLPGVAVRSLVVGALHDHVKTFLPADRPDRVRHHPASFVHSSLDGVIPSGMHGDIRRQCLDFMRKVQYREEFFWLDESCRTCVTLSGFKLLPLS